MNVTNTNSHDPSGQSDLESWKDVQGEYLHKANTGFHFSPLTGNQKSGRRFAKELTMVISRTGEGGVLTSDFIQFCFFFFFAIVDKLGIIFLCKPNTEICS